MQGQSCSEFKCHRVAVQHARVCLPCEDACGRPSDMNASVWMHGWGWREAMRSLPTWYELARAAVVKVFRFILSVAWGQHWLFETRLCPIHSLVVDSAESNWWCSKIIIHSGTWNLLLTIYRDNTKIGYYLRECESLRTLANQRCNCITPQNNFTCLIFTKRN